MRDPGWIRNVWPSNINVSAAAVEYHYAFTFQDPSTPPGLGAFLLWISAASKARWRPSAQAVPVAQSTFSRFHKLPVQLQTPGLVLISASCGLHPVTPRCDFVTSLIKKRSAALECPWPGCSCLTRALAAIPEPIKVHLQVLLLPRVLSSEPVPRSSASSFSSLVQCAGLWS